VLEQLGARVEAGDASSPGLVIHGPESWRTDRPLTIDRGLSSQFASGVLLSAWELEAPLTVRFTGEAVSEGYFSMTRELVRRAGLTVEESVDAVTVPPGQKVRPDTYRAEIDLSSAFALAAAAAVAGEANITPFPESSLQPDRVFVDILRAMGVPVERAGSTLRVRRAARLESIEWCLRDSPDLFPVLGVLCSLAEGRSRLFGAPHLGLKESNRIARTVELISALGRTVEERPDGLIVHGQGLDRVHDRPFPFDPDHDHRLAMAAGVARKAGFAVEVSEPDVVNKSFPSFWSTIGESP
jgi:3-phosphoshikimate 1-carboxyvinyltransferase